MKKSGLELLLQAVWIYPLAVTTFSLKLKLKGLSIPLNRSRSQIFLPIFSNDSDDRRYDVSVSFPRQRHIAIKNHRRRFQYCHVPCAIQDFIGATTYFLTLTLLMSYICGAPSKARNANVVYIWTYVWQRWNSLFLFAALCQLAGKVFTHKCDTGNLSALIQCWNIVQQIERDSCSVAKRRSIYIRR